MRCFPNQETVGAAYQIRPQVSARTQKRPQHESFSYNAQFHLQADNGDRSGYDVSYDRVYQPVRIR
jgi:hypothetical protein